MHLKRQTQSGTSRGRERCAIAEAQLLRSHPCSGPAASFSPGRGLLRIFQLGFEGFWLGDEADDTAAIAAILDAEVGHEIADAALAHQLRRVVRHLRWRVAAGFAVHPMVSGVIIVWFSLIDGPWWPKSFGG